MTKKNYVYLLILIGVVVFLNSLFNGFVWDDEEQVLNNVLVHSFSNFFHFFSSSTFNTGGTGSLGGLYYKPLMTTFFSIIYTIFGPNPFFFHLFQVSLHIINSIFVFLIFRLLFKKDLLPFVLAIFFLIHPINAEAVVYVSDLQDILFFFFGIVALWRVIAYLLSSFKEYFLLFLLLLFSLLSKETGILFLCVTFLYIILFLRKKLLSFLITAFFSAGVYSILRFLLAGIFFNKHGLSPITIMSFSERLVSVPKLTLFYFKTFVYPVDLAINQHWVVKSFNLNEFYMPLAISIVILGFFIILGIYFYFKKNEYSILYIFFLLWFLVGLGMHLHIIFPLDLTVSDRWFYFPMIGLLGMIGIIIQQIKIKNIFLKKILSIGLILLIMIFSLRTIIRNTNWKDGLSLYNHDINISINAFDLENNLGVELYRVGQFDAAEIHFTNSTKLAPNWWTNWNNLGVIFERKNDIAGAKKYYQKAIDNGQYYLAYENLAKIYFRTQSPEVTASFALESLKILPNNANLWSILSLVEYKLGNKEKALTAAKNAYLLNQNEQNYYVYSHLSQNLPLEIK